MKLKMPRIKGARSTFGLWPPAVGQLSSTISPETCRTAMEVVSGPRIIIPSMRACPPMEVFFPGQAFLVF